MSSGDQGLERGVISFEQAERLDVDPGPDRPGGPRTVEVLGYVAALALLIATIAAVAKVAFPDDVRAFLLRGFDNVPGGLIALAGAVLTFGTGYRLAAAEGAVRRTAGFLMLTGYALASLGFALLLMDLDVGDATPLAVTLPSAAVAVLGWRRLRAVPTQLALFVAAVGLLHALLVLFQVETYRDPAAVAFGMAMGGVAEFGSWISRLANVALGVVWVWLSYTGVLRPRNTAFLIGTVYSVVLGLVLYSTADGWLALSAALVVAYAWTAMHWRSSVLGAVAAVAGIALVAQVMDVVHDAPGTTEVILWFGVPGTIALAAAWILGSRTTGGVSPPAGD